MTIKVVWRDVENYGDFRPESFNGFQLEARNFQNDGCAARGLLDQGNCRRTDVSADYSRPPSCGDDFPYKRSSCSLSIGASNRHNRPAKKLSCQFNFTDDFFAESARLDKRWSIHRNARTDDDQILPTKSALTVATCFHGNTAIKQQWNFFAQLIGVLAVRHGNLRTLIFQEKR